MDIYILYVHQIPTFQYIVLCHEYNLILFTSGGSMEAGLGETVRLLQCDSGVTG